MKKESTSSPPEKSRHLLLLALSPAIWAAHFLLCYITVAVWCAKFGGPVGSLSGARVAVALYTAVALAGILLTGWQGLRMHQYGAATVPHDFDTPEDRHRFLGFATVLLTGLSAVATIFVALAAVFIESCR